LPKKVGRVGRHLRSLAHIWKDSNIGVYPGQLTSTVRLTILAPSPSQPKEAS
jgi:hypothetical protein